MSGSVSTRLTAAAEALDRRAFERERYAEPDDRLEAVRDAAISRATANLLRVSGELHERARGTNKGDSATRAPHFVSLMPFSAALLRTGAQRERR